MITLIYPCERSIEPLKTVSRYLGGKMPVYGSPLALGVLTFAFGCVVAALFLLGVDKEPADKIGVGNAVVFRLIGIMLLPIGVPVLLITNGAGTLTGWVAVIWGLFGVIWLGFAELIHKGADFRPLSYFSVFVGIMLVYSVWIANQIGSWQFTYGLSLAALTCFSAFGAMRFKPLWMKICGVLFLATGLWFAYVGLDMMWPLPAA